MNVLLRVGSRPPRALCVLLALALVLSGWPLGPARASGRAGLTLTATPDVIFADGKNATTITATVRDGNGGIAADGTTVRFTTSLGVLDRDTVTTEGGVARVSLTSASQPGTATVTATSFLGTADGSSTGSAPVEFTTDRDSVYAVGDSRWIQVEAPHDLLYSADSKIVEAHGRNGGAHLRFKSLDITADALQMDLQAQKVLARNATLTRSHHSLQAVEIQYDLNSGMGIAVVAGPDARHAFQSVRVSGYTLQTTRLDDQAAQDLVTTNLYRFVDISDSHVIVSARALDISPNDKIQFRRASFYSDGKKVLAVPYHVMSVSSNELFGQQLVGFGSLGFFVNVPFYYHVSPHSTGTLYLRNSALAGASSSALGTGTSFNSFGQNGSRPGLALDLEHSYSLGRGGTGALSLTGLTRSEWGAHWNHSQRIDDVTNSYLYVDYPSHRSLYASSSVSRQFPGFSMSVSGSGSRTPGFAGYSSANTAVSAYLQTNTKALGQSGVNMTTGFSVQQAQLVQTSPKAGRIVIPVSTRSLDFRFFTAPIRPDRNTSINDSLTIGQSWGRRGQSAPTVLGTLGLTRATFGHGNMTLNYTYRYDPLFSQLGSSSTADNPLGSLYRSKSQQRMTLGYGLSPRPRLNISLFGSYGLPLHDSNLFTYVDYRVNDNWGLGLSSSWDHYAVARYSETQLSVARRVLGRDLIFTYSSKTKKLRFDFASLGLPGM